MSDVILFTLNGKAVTLNTDSDRSLLWVLRTDYGLTGAKYGCGEGHCGSCTVLVDNEAQRSCQLTLADVDGASVITIEGLANNGSLHPVQQAFIDEEALQCGYCTPGMILTAVALLHKNPTPSEVVILDEMDGNLCRCGSYKRIVRAINSAANVRKEEP
jgi:aerobic-type carbon monoxide dehydrogenase small subunit (CoxS/CutS family)